jgi:hypothetical protein
MNLSTWSLSQPKKQTSAPTPEKSCRSTGSGSAILVFSHFADCHLLQLAKMYMKDCHLKVCHLL